MRAGLAAVIVPTLNEAAHIETILDGLLRQEPDRVVQVIVVDGGSVDGTREAVKRLAEGEPRLRLIDNPARIQAAGVNLAAAEADPAADVLVRVDAHSRYAGDFLSRILEVLDRGAADSVVVRLHTVGSSCFSRAVASVSNSRFGAGGAKHRVGGGSGFIDHGHHAGFRRQAFLAVGGYDEAFAANEDAEFDQRLRSVGGRIWFASDICVEYHPRGSWPSLARQYFRYGRGRAANLRKHHWRGLRPRQCAPPAAVLGLGAAMVLAPWFPWMLSAPAAYLGFCTALATAASLRRADPCLLGGAAALPIMHLAWGTGFLMGLADRAGVGLARAPSRAAAGGDRRTSSPGRAG